MKIIKYILSPNHEKYEGVRPINVYLLRLFYFLMFIGVATEAWQKLATETSWDHTKAVAWCVWAAYPTLAVFGLIRPLRWLPIFVFMIFYKTVWLFVVAYPLWRAGTLVGSTAEEMARVFVAAPFLVIIVPWGYFVREFVFPARRSSSG